MLKAVDEKRASPMVILGAVVSVPIVFVNVLNKIASLILVSGADFLGALAPDQGRNPEAGEWLAEPPILGLDRGRPGKVWPRIRAEDREDTIRATGEFH